MRFVRGTMSDVDLNLYSSGDPASAGRAEEGRAERKDAAENRARIVETARALFAERGVANVHMAEIAQAANVGKGTLYRRFANKAELYQALMHDQLQRHQDGTLAELRRLHRAGTRHLEQLKFFLAATVEFTEQHIPLLCEMQQAGLGGDVAGPEVPHFAWQQMTIRGLLQAAVRAGELSPEFDLPLVADLLLAPLAAPYYRYLRSRQGFSTTRIAEGLCASVDRLAQGGDSDGCR
jgi:AcrR family transcriptional regulator